MVTARDLMSQEFLSVQKEEPISKVIGKLILEDLRTAIVMWKKKYIGIIDRDLLVESKIDSTSAEAGTFVAHPPVVGQDEDLLKCAELMYGSYPCSLPIKRGNQVLGVVRARDILQHLPSIPQLRKLKVADVMSSSLIVFDYDARLGDAINIMHEKGFGRVPVVDKAGHVSGVFSLTDVIYKHLKAPNKKVKGSKGSANFFSKSYTPDKLFILSTPIGDAASPITITASKDDQLGKVVEDMAKYKISDVVVVENQKPVGIVTTRDLLRAFTLLKEPDFWKLHFIGLNKLKPLQAKFVREIVSEHYEKIRRAYFKEFPRYFLTEIKLYEEPGKQKRIKYSVHIRLAMPSQVFSTEHAHFDLNTAMSWALREMERMIQDFKEATRQRWRGYRKGRRKEFGTFIYEQEMSKGVSKKQYKPKLVKR